MKTLFSEFLPPERGRARRARAAGAYLMLLFLALPLVMWDGYFDVTETKAYAYMGLSALLLLEAGISLLWDPREALRGAPGLSGGELCMLAFAGVSLLAAIASGSFRETILGASNRYQGLLTIALYAAVFFLLARRGGFTAGALACLMGGLAAVCALGVVNHLGGDPLGVVAPLRDFDRGRYISTLGNINFYGSYVTLLWPVGAVLLCRTERPRLRALLAALALLGLWGAMASKSESTVLGFAAALALLPLLPGTRAAVLRREALLLPALAAGMQLFALLSKLCGGDGFSALTSLLLRPALSAALALAGLGAYLLLRRADEARAARARRLYGRALLAGAAVLGVFLILANTVIPAQSLGALARFAVFDEDWGTDRGLVWRHCWQMWRGFPWWQKLIGGGAGCVARLDRLNRIFSDAVLDAAHNEYLQYLLTSGVLGLAAYMGLLFHTLRGALRRDGSGLSAALALGVLAYLAQAAVNIAQPVSTPLLFALLGVLAGRERAAQSPPRPPERKKRGSSKTGKGNE